MGMAMLILFAITLLRVVPLLTEPPGLAMKYLDKTTGGIDGPFLAALEYESFAIRTQGIQIALGFLVGILLGAFGLLLFAIGATDAVELAGSARETKLNLKSTAPGLVVMLMSGAVISFAVTKDVRRKFDATYQQGAEAPRIESRDSDSPPHMPSVTSDTRPHR
jgi:hypothetical protein